MTMSKWVIIALYIVAQMAVGCDSNPQRESAMRVTSLETFVSELEIMARSYLKNSKGLVWLSTLVFDQLLG